MRLGNTCLTEDMGLIEFRSHNFVVKSLHLPGHTAFPGSAEWCTSNIVLVCGFLLNLICW
jgi:hypothetical protein